MQVTLLTLALFFGSTLATSIGRVPQNTTSLEVTALVGQHSLSAFQCWKIHPDFDSSPEPGVAGPAGFSAQLIGDVTGGRINFYDTNNITFIGLHTAPAPQWVIFISGGGYITLPMSGIILPIKTGDIIITNDTSAVSLTGRYSTWFPGTVIVELPFADEQVNHTVLYDGTCTS